MTRPYESDSAPHMISQRVSAGLMDVEGTIHPIETELHYDPTDVLAVTTEFKTKGNPIRWTFGRELFSDGIYEPTGDGDVHVWPSLSSEGRAVVILELISPNGEALVQIPTPQMAEFVDKMHAEVQPGTESDHLHIDEELKALFDD